MDTVSKLFSPARFAGECYLVHRHFKRVPSGPSGGKLLSAYNGKSIVVVTPTTPLCLDYNTAKEQVAFSFYVQRYTAEDFAIDSTLQAIMNN